MIQNIWCIGRSYAEHAKELNNEIPDTPLIFLKSGGCAEINHGQIKLTNEKDEFHYEVELALRFGANFEFDAYTVAIDLTNRSAQRKLKAKGKPWTLAKSFKGACPLANWQSIYNLDLENVDIELSVNGAVKQKANTELLLFPIQQIREYLLQNFPVQEGDIYLSGTPAGVGPLHKNDILIAKAGEVEK
ncbi:MAG: fumarylacetoacetate hydrolase family protein, partial [Bdellovibrionota bacterium]|nr:fumarylacetoacetate hydrolase family protein [Bdellovibrionota bacterium]